MIKFERKTTEKAAAAQKALTAAKIAGRSYNTPEVNEALQEMFHGKCYICESKKITSCQIEHLIPHKGNVDLKYDWDNLFWSCAHCNNTKNGKYDPILDCSEVDVDRKISFRKKGFFGVQESYCFEAVEQNPGVEIKNTIDLLEEVYYGSTPQKKMEASNIRRELRENLSHFKNLVRDYAEAEEYDKEDYRAAIRRETGQGAAFAAFKRWLLWDNSEKYGELVGYCGLDMK